MKEKLKSWLLNDQIFYGLLVIFVAITSFTLGRLSIEKAEKTPQSAVQIIEPITLTATTPLANSAQINSKPPILINSTKTNLENEFVASKNGKRYYLKNCAGAKRIKPENLISFESRELAEAAGYTKATNCSGL